MSAASETARPHRVVIVGGGFGGLYAAQALKRAPVDVTVIDRRNFHLFQPLLYQVATGGLSPGDISSPIRWILRRHHHTRVLLADVIDIEPSHRTVLLRDGATIPYDTLVIATGAGHDYFGQDEWEPHAPGLKTVEDAIGIRRRILYAFEAAERAELDAERSAWLTFVVVGAGPTGVELAGALAELSRDTLRRDFRAIDPSGAKIILAEGMDRVLPPYPNKLSEKAKTSLERLGVTVRLGTFVTDVREDGVAVKTGDDTDFIPTRCVLWAAGVRASSLGNILGNKVGAPLDKPGRVKVGRDLTVPHHPEIFVIGDLALAEDEDGNALPGVAPVAMQQGRYVAATIRKRQAGQETPPFHYTDKGSLATIGRSAAVADMRGLRFSGWLAWFLWLVVHLAYLVGFQNRVLVFIQWAWHYFTRNRGARLIVDHGGSRAPEGTSSKASAPTVGASSDC
jgi:NADH dehydrogenase